jgi:hypothetical protein
MPHAQVVISVHGGYVIDVFCSVEDAEVVLVDWDVEPGGFSLNVVDVIRSGRSRNVLVGCFDALPLRDLSGTDEADAIFQSACVRTGSAESESSSAIRCVPSSC